MHTYKSWLFPLLVIILFAAILLLRTPALDSFATIDETKWLLRSANFYQALRGGELENTYQSEHPGVTITWVGTVGFIQNFRGYAKLAGEQMPGPTKFDRFLRKQRQDPAKLLAAGRMYMVLAITVVHFLTFLAAMRLVGFIPTLLGFVLLAFDPFLISLSRLLHLDGLSSALMLLSLLWLMDYLFVSRKLTILLVSGFAAGLSWLTKSPALFLIPFCCILILTPWIKDLGHQFKKKTLFKNLWLHGKVFLLWLLAGIVIFFLIWPSMWVNSLGTLQKIFTEAMNYAVEGNQNVIFFNGQIYQSGETTWYYYPVAFLWRTTPIVLGGLLLTLIIVLIKKPTSMPSNQYQFVWILSLYAISFILLMSLAGQKYDRYILPSMLALILVAGMGWYWLLQEMKNYVIKYKSTITTKVFTLITLTLLLAYLIWGAVSTYPYYYQYYNPLLGGIQGATKVMQIGLGEGLDQAARYLNTKNKPGRLRVISWYGDAPFAFFFKGATINMPEDATLADLQNADYIVIYYQQIQRQLPSPMVLEFFEAQTPEYTVSINGLDFAKVYNLNNITFP
jgi:hypothetical protein